MERPTLIILSGIPLTGKTFTAKKIQEEFFGIQHRDVDQYRQFFEKEKSFNIKSDYELKIMKNCYKALCKDAFDFLQSGNSIIISGTFSRKVFKKYLQNLIRKIKNKYRVVSIELQLNDEQEIEKRIKKRVKENSLSNVNNIEKFNWAKTIFEPITFLTTYIYDTSKKDYVNRLFWLLRSYE